MRRAVVSGMLRPTVVVTLAIPLLACGASDPAGSSGSGSDLTLSQVFIDVAPMICGRLQQCNPSSFASSFPNGESDCETAFESTDTNPGRVVQCTQEQATACGNDIQNEACDELDPASGSPTLPASCDGC